MPSEQDLIKALISKGGHTSSTAAGLITGRRGDADPNALHNLYVEFLGKSPFGSVTPQTTQTSNAAAEAKAREEAAIARLRETSGQAIGTLQEGADPLRQRYEDLIASIKGTAEQETKRADITSAQELARRGIPTSSTFAAEYQQEKRLPVQTAFQSQEAALGLSAEQAQQNIRQAIAGIQQATGINEVQAALDFYRQTEQTRQFSEQQALAQSQFGLQEQESKLQQEMLRKQIEQMESGTDFSRYITLGGGSTLFDLVTGQSIFTAPKTSTAGGNDPFGLGL